MQAPQKTTNGPIQSPTLDSGALKGSDDFSLKARNAVTTNRRFLAERLRSRWSIDPKLEYDPTSESFLIVGSGEHVAKIILERIEKNPKYAEELVSAARVECQKASPILRRMEESYDKPGIPFEDVARMFREYILQANTGGLDALFDFEAYRKVMGGHLKSGGTQVDHDLFMSETASNGLDVDYTTRRNMLLHLACEFGRSSGDSGAYAFGEYSWDWYRKNYISKSIKLNAFVIGEGEQKAELAQFMEREGLEDRDYEKVVEKLKRLSRERLFRIEERESALKRLVENAKPESKETVNALAYFAGQAHAINEEMDVQNQRAGNLVRMAAEKRGARKQEVLDTIVSAFSSPPA